MTTFIYSYKNCTIKDQNGLLPEGTIAIYQHIYTICELASCTALAYISWWLTALASWFAPSSDLYHYILLNQYPEINALVSRNNLYAFSRHP